MPFDLPPVQDGTAQTAAQIAARDAAVLAHVQSGDYSATWAVLAATSPAGRRIDLEMMADALSIGGVRVNVTAAGAQQIADALGCLLPTPKIADLLYLTAKARGPVIMPSPQMITSTTQAMIDHSRRIDAAFANVTLPPTTDGSAPPVQTVGKHWVLTNGLLAHPGRACNYGWHVAGVAPRGRWGGVYVDYAVTPGLGCIQAMGFAHDPAHVDYSQICQLVHGRCKVDGVDTDTRTALQDPDLSQALSHEGPLQILRQPGAAAGRQVAEPGSQTGARAFLRRWAAPIAGGALGFAAGGPGGAAVGFAAGLGVDWGVDTVQRTRT